MDVVPAQHGGVVLAPTQGSPVEEAKADTNLAGEPKQQRVDLPDPPAMETAVPGRLEGHGMLVVVRDADGTVAAADGTWRPADAAAGALRAAPDGLTAGRHARERVFARARCTGVRA